MYKILFILFIFLLSSCATQKSARSRYEKTKRNPISVQARPVSYNQKGPLFWESYLDRYKRNPNKYLHNRTVEWELYLYNYNRTRRFSPSNLEWEKHLNSYKGTSRKPPVKSKYQRFHRRKQCTL